MDKKVIGVLVGSLRRESFSKKIAKFLVASAPEDFEFKLIDLDGLVVYNQDFDDDGNAPQRYTEFRNELKKVEGFLFVTPEYNRSIPGVLKNALDVGSRPYGQSVWDGKPAGIVSVTPGGLSGFGANHHLRQPLVFLNVPVLQQPEAYIGNVTQILDENGNINNEHSAESLRKFVDAFVKWVDLINKK